MSDCWVPIIISNLHELNYSTNEVRNKYSKHLLKPIHYNGKQYYTIHDTRYTFRQLKYLNCTVPTVPLPPDTCKWESLKFDSNYEICIEEKKVRTRTTGHVIKESTTGKIKLKHKSYPIEQLINNQLSPEEYPIEKPKPKEPLICPPQDFPRLPNGKLDRSKIIVSCANIID
jgi:hypothetical protein